MADPEIRIKIKADAKEATKTFGDLAREVPGVGRAMDLLKNPIALVVAGLAAIATGVRAMVASFSEAQEASAGLDATLANTGNLTAAYRERLQQLASQLEKTTGLADDKWVGVLERLPLFGSRPETIGMDIDAVKNLAGILKGDLAGASELVARAMEGNFTGFQRLLPQFEATGNAAKDLQNLYQMLAEKGAGLLEARQKTLAGQSRTLANSWDNLKEAGGELVNRTGILQAVMYGLATSMTWLVDKFGSAVPALEGLKNKMGEARVDTNLMKQAVDELKQKLAENKTALEEEIKVLDRRRDKLTQNARAQDEIRSAALAAEKSAVDRAVAEGKITPEEGLVQKQGIERQFAQRAQAAKEEQLALEESLVKQQLDALNEERTRRQEEIFQLKRETKGEDKAVALRAEAEQKRQAMETARAEMLKSQQFMNDLAARAPIAAVDDSFLQDTELQSTRFSGRANRFLVADRAAKREEHRINFARERLAAAEAGFAEFDPLFQDKGTALIDQLQGIGGQRNTGRKKFGLQSQAGVNEDITELLGARTSLVGQRDQMAAGFLKQIQSQVGGDGSQSAVAALDRLNQTTKEGWAVITRRIDRIDRDLRYLSNTVAVNRDGR